MIVVAGECLVDLLPAGKPAADGIGTLRPILGGGPFTAARAVGRLGGDVAFLGTLSTDAYGQAARASLRESGVRDDWAPDTELPTTLAAVDLSRESARYLFYTEATSAPALTAAQADAVLAAPPTALLVGTLGLVLEPCADALAALVDRVPGDCLVMVDPNTRPAALTRPDVAARYRDRLQTVLGRADVIKVSTEDLAWLSPMATPADAAAQLAVDNDALVLVTDGGDGVLVRTARGKAWVDVPKVTVVDTVGAGDSFCGGFLASWAAGGRPPGPELADLTPAGAVLTAVRHGVTVAAITCTRVGADPPTAAELTAVTG